MSTASSHTRGRRHLTGSSQSHASPLAHRQLPVGRSVCRQQRHPGPMIRARCRSCVLAPMSRARIADHGGPPWQRGAWFEDPRGEYIPIADAATLGGQAGDVSGDGRWALTAGARSWPKTSRHCPALADDGAAAPATRCPKAVAARGDGESRTAVPASSSAGNACQTTWGEKRRDACVGA